MENSTAIPKFNDITRPPVGGWSYYTDRNNPNTLFRKASPSEVFDVIERHRRNNGKFTSREEIEREIWAHWCSYQPERCGLVRTAGEPTGPLLPKEITKEFFGPILWRFLNLAAVRFEFIGREGFFNILQQVGNMMTCPTCREHWEEMLVKFPPFAITTALEACKWVNDIHNAVNQSLGKPIYPYERGVREYGFPIAA